MAVSIHVSQRRGREDYARELSELLERADHGMDVYRTLLQPLLGGKPLRLGLSYLSPFRPEKHPSFNLFRSRQDGNVWWCDQASESGDALKFIMRLRGCDFREAVRVLRGEVLGLPPDPDHLERLGSFYLGPPPVRPRVEVIEYPKLITPLARAEGFYRGEFAALDESYYPRHLFGEPVLAAYHCQPLAGYRYEQFNPDPQLARNFTVRADAGGRQPMYAYGFDGGRQKVVRPYMPPHPTTGRPRKWLSNTQREHDFFGAHLLPRPGQGKVEAVVLLAGNRDTMAFHQLTGVPAVASTAEGHLPTDEQLHYLRTVSERQYVLYDNDPTGRKFEAVLSDDWASPHYAGWLDKHPDRKGQRFGLQGGLGTLLDYFQVNDVVALLQDRPAEYHPRLGTWFRQAMGLY